MFGVRLSSLFRSRWLTLCWAVLVCLSAISFVGGLSQGEHQDAKPNDDAPSPAVNARD